MRAKKIDNNQAEIVQALRSIPGVSVAVGHDDILVGRKGRTYWYEIKSERQVSKRTGKVLRVEDSQQKLLDTWKGHYRVVSSLDEILRDLL